MTASGHLRLRNLVLQYEAETGEKMTQGEFVERLMGSFAGRLPSAADPLPSAPVVSLDSKLYLKASQAVAMLQDVLEEWPHAKAGSAGQDTGTGTASEGGDLEAGNLGPAGRGLKKKAR